ncbi:V-type proton ATPase subunit G 1-like [Vigna radiata var. radiata]|uniref:V-type proton ATPase subunit G n=1 Tax=Vigna radiata var. radiata TaxID=3916 RepID=A0A1S3TSY1_VIGRR|nr:V-type proton ATPase subunit G 1-like [Vigna radiata var. radiata]XP_022635259.1 V-type proton ATPase subunit G 1-like [Vigna radiata var. radiata]
MDPFKGQGGIQMLLTAEQEAQHIISNARNLRTQRLKQAKEEAEKEAAQYRSHMEDEYQNSISETTGTSGSNVKRLEEETEAKIKLLKKSTSDVSSKVVEMLLKCVTNIKI